ncbi:MAG: BlaI/MecI/CopY family transcriptional regulator [Lachnospiraceae bacterium]
MSKRTVFTELSVCETLIMRQIWAYEGDIPVQTLITKLNEEYGKNYARTTVVTFLSKLKDKKFVETYRVGKMSYAKALRTEKDYRRQVIQDDADFWFDGKPSALLASLLEKRKLTKDEASKIEELIKNAK